MSADSIHLEPNLKLDNIYKKLSKAQAKNVFVFMDSCFSGKDDEGSLLYKGVAPVLRTKKTVISSNKLTILTAGKSTDFANDFQAKQQRMFTYYLIKELASGSKNLNKIYPDILSIKPNKDIYIENDDMFFYIRHNNQAYISVLYVEHNGKVGILLANKKSKKSFVFPDIKKEDVLKIINPYGKTIKELYVVLSSKEPINLHKFENISDSLLDESNYNFDKLLLKLNEYNFSTYEIKIRK